MRKLLQLNDLLLLLLLLTLYSSEVLTAVEMMLTETRFVAILTSAGQQACASGNPTVSISKRLTVS
jgi:hypothetical protein